MDGRPAINWWGKIRGAQHAERGSAGDNATDILAMVVGEFCTACGGKGTVSAGENGGSGIACPHPWAPKLMDGLQAWERAVRIGDGDPRGCPPELLGTGMEDAAWAAGWDAARRLILDGGDPGQAGGTLPPGRAAAGPSHP